MKTTNKLLIAGTIVALGVGFYLKRKKYTLSDMSQSKGKTTGTTVDNVSNPDVEDIKQPAPTPVKPAPTPVKPSPKPYRPSQEEMEQAERERLARKEAEKQASLRRVREQREAERQREARKEAERREREARLRREREQRESSRNQISLPSGGYDIDIPIFERPRFDTGNRDGSISSGRGGTTAPSTRFDTGNRDGSISSGRGGTRPVSSRVKPRRVRDTGVLNRGNTGMMRFTGDASDVDLLNLRVH